MSLVAGLLESRTAGPEFKRDLRGIEWGRRGIIKRPRERDGGGSVLLIHRFDILEIEGDARTFPERITGLVQEDQLQLPGAQARAFKQQTLVGILRAQARPKLRG